MVDDAGRFKTTAVDKRPPMEQPIPEACGAKEAPYDVGQFKAMLGETLQGSLMPTLRDASFRTHSPAFDGRA